MAPFIINIISKPYIYDWWSRLQAFGLTVINDDHFFSSVGVVSNCFNGAGRIFWGLVYDRYSGQHSMLCTGT